MPIAFRFAARSDVGKTRTKNDDSAYAGRYLAVVADGMGGHVGGDVASASAVIDLTHLDRTGHHGEAETILADEIQNANQNLVKLVRTNPNLGGMGTTVTSLLLDGDEIAIAHIGDSRAYRHSEARGFEQVTRDHTFVQRLVDEGRLRPEDAESHPHKNVLMRVLGDVDASPEIEVQTVRPSVGERWILCSDGLNAVVSESTIKNVAESTPDLNELVDALVELTLERGAPDNVTVVVVQVEDIPEGSDIHPHTAEIVGAIPDTNPTSEETLVHEDLWFNGGLDSPVAGGGRDYREPGYGPENQETSEPRESSAAALRRDLGERPYLLVGAAANATQTGRIPTVSDSAMQRRATLVPTDNLELPPDPDAVRKALFENLRARPEGSKRRRALLVLLALLAAAALLLGGWAAKTWTSAQFYVGEDQGKVAIYNGFSQKLGPVSLSSLQETTDLTVESLPAYVQDRVRSTIPAGSREEADQIVRELRSAGDPSPRPTGKVSIVSPSPSPAASSTERPSPSPTRGGGEKQ